jgi:hypothetical protein
MDRNGPSEHTLAKTFQVVISLGELLLSVLGGCLEEDLHSSPYVLYGKGLLH